MGKKKIEEGEFWLFLERFPNPCDSLRTPDLMLRPNLLHMISYYLHDSSLLLLTLLDKAAASRATRPVIWFLPTHFYSLEKETIY